MTLDAAVSPDYEKLTKLVGTGNSASQESSVKVATPGVEWGGPDAGEVSTSIGVFKGVAARIA